MGCFLGVKIQKKPNNFCQTHYIGGVGMWGVIVAQPPWVKEDVYYRRTYEKLAVMLLWFKKTLYLWK